MVKLAGTVVSSVSEVSIAEKSQTQIMPYLPPVTTCPLWKTDSIIPLWQLLPLVRTNLTIESCHKRRFPLSVPLRFRFRFRHFAVEKHRIARNIGNLALKLEAVNVWAISQKRMWPTPDVVRLPLRVSKKVTRKTSCEKALERRISASFSQIKLRFC